MRNIFLLTLLLAAAISSCTDILQEQEVVKNLHAATKVQTSLWEDCEQCYLPSGEKVNTPWNEVCKTCIPNDIRYDIKSSDGWIILDSTVELIGYNMDIKKADDGCNYLLMYNKRTGMLKCFYYMENYIENNYGFWLLETTQKTRLFDFTGKVAVPISEEGPQKIATSNLTRNFTTQGFESGWNCFALELAYDENSDQQKLDISGFALNKIQLNLQGGYEGGGNGVIVSNTTSPSSPVLGIVKHIGEGALEWVMGELEEKEDSTKAVTRSINFPLIAKTLQKIVDSFSGSSNTSYDFNFTAKGSITISGELISATSGIISPITGLNLGNSDMDLGIWNLETQPLHQIADKAKLWSIAGTNKERFIYEIQTKPEVGIKVNPSVRQPYSVNIYPILADTITIYADEMISQGSKWSKTYSDYYKPYFNSFIENNVYMSLEYDWNYLVSLYWEDAWPNYKLHNDSESPAIGLAYGDIIGKFNMTQPLAYRILFKSDADQFYSLKTFIPKQVLEYQSIGGHPFTWHSTSEFQAHGVFM